MIAILGTGLLGSGFARALLRKGEHVHVWNRTPEKARALEADGARAFGDPAEAARGADRVHVVLADDGAVDQTLAAAAGEIVGKLVVDHTTTSTAGARARTASWPARGVTYLHAPVFMGPQNALEGTGLMLVSGEPELVARVRPLLAPMTGKLVELGPRVDAAAAFKLLGNLLLVALAGGFTDMLSLGKAMGVAPAEVASLLDFFNPGGSLAARMQRVVSADFEHASWTLAMARKDARLMQAEADIAAVPLIAVPAIAAQMDAMLARGFAELDWSVIAKDALAPR
ncbi:MAG TPA: NAD(P)-binding domain-containing protein [Kofleriaceae bacterium]|nr:NAD(P)-binding domain-containing protein [Kofleriaceae bacterium]